MATIVSTSSTLFSIFQVIGNEEIERRMIQMFLLSIRNLPHRLSDRFLLECGYVFKVRLNEEIGRDIDATLAP